MRRWQSDYLRALWPSFLVAVVVSAVGFALVSPSHVQLAGAAHGWAPEVLYSLGFLAQWLACWAASVLTLWLLARRPRGAHDVFEDGDEA